MQILEEFYFGPIVDLIAFVGDVFLSACNVFLVDGQMQQDGGNFFDMAMISINNFESNPDKYKDSQYSEDGEMANPRVVAKEKINGLWGDGTKIPISMYSPQKIFSGQVPAFDVNFINPKDWGETAKNERSTAVVLHDAIAKWYVALRNLTIVGMLIILLYVGIRIIVSSTASDKAKWKEFLKDWLIALCLLFTLHYIMTFTVTVVNSITESIIGESTSTNTIPVVVVEGDTVQGTQSSMGTVSSVNDVTGTIDFSFNTDIMGYARFLVQHDDFGTKLLYLAIYLGMVILTIMFTFTYIKRALTIAFLTVIAPLISLTYPIDKIGDGSAQGFNSWLKEYIYNILIQPFHLIIYTVFAGVAVVDLSATNPIYAILVLWFILQSEKLLGKFFGFEKASSAGSLASFAGGAAAMKLTQSLIGKAAKGGNGKGGNGKDGNIRTSSNSAVEDQNGPGIGDYALPGDGEETNRSSTNNDGQRNNGLDNADYDDMYLNPDKYSAKQEELDKLNREKQEMDERERINRTEQEQQSNEEPQDYGENQNNVRPVPTNSSKGETKRKLRLPPKVKGAMNVAKYVGKPIARTAVRFGLGATGAAIGVAAGVASGNDIGDIIQYGATGATLGATMGYQALGNAATGIPRTARNLGYGIADAYREGAYGRNEAQMAAQRRDYVNDKNFVEDLNMYMPTEDGIERSNTEKKELANRAVDYMEATGVTDARKLAKAMKLEGKIAEDMKDVKGLTDEEKSEHARKKAQIAAQYLYNDKIDKKKLANDEYVETQIKSWTKAMTNPEKGVSAKKARKEAEQMMGYVSKLAKVNNKYN